MQFCIAGAPNPFVIVLQNTQADFSIRIWTYLVPILKKQTSKKTDLVHFRSSFLLHKSRPNSSTNIFVNSIETEVVGETFHCQPKVAEDGEVQFLQLILVIICNCSIRTTRVYV